MILLWLKSYPTNYYFSASGNDGNNGLSPATAWQTIAKFNSVFASKSPGDNFLFNRGDVFVGELIIGRAGSAGLPITVGAYGSGAKPIISGFAAVSSWSNLGGNIWESTTPVSTLATLNMVTINGVNTAMGRTPNYPSQYIWQSHGGTQGTTNTNITSSDLNSGVINWAGAELALWANTYIMSRHPVLSQSGSVLTYNSTAPQNTDIFQNSPGYFLQNFFIENDVRTLDVQNEWYYNPSTKKIRIYSTSSPTNVKVATVPILVSLPSFKDYIIIRDLAFEGSNGDAILVGGVNHTTIVACDFNFIGGNCVTGGSFGGPPFVSNIIDTCYMNQVQNMGVDVWEDYYVRGNTIKNVGMLPGMNSVVVSGVTPNSDAIAVRTRFNGAIISGNNFDSIGLVAIDWYGSNLDIGNNFINHACNGSSRKDGGAIYMWNGGSGSVLSGNKIHDNIILNTGLFSQGIYFDSKGNGSEVYNNSIQGGEWGIYLGQSTYNINVHNNTVYDPKVSCLTVDARTVDPSNNYVFRSNIFFAKQAAQFCLWTLNGGAPTMPTPFTSDSNYFARPINDNLTIQTYLGGTNTQRNLAQWRTLNGTDANSKKSPVTISNVNQLDFEYNATNIAAAKTLPPGIWIDVFNNSYSGTITLQPYTSAVLINTGASNISPTANAGIDQTIQLPTSTINLAGTANDPDGTISSVLWTRVSGSGTITSPTSLNTTVTGLTGGVSQFKLTATDNLGASGSDIMQVTVNPANVSPTANAGTDQAITLPTNSTTLTGSGNDPDGSITAYAWTKTSGGAATITSPSSATTTVTGMVAGTYVFRLTVTDNQAATGFDELTVVVSASANQAPTANAGIDQTIQLPTSSVNLVGSGNDPDGSIVGYLWTQISGAAATITSPATASTSVTGMATSGVYQFKLTVTDNGGLTGSDNILITVTPANISPLANAGSDQSITLPTTSITFAGSANDPDGTISNHTWTKISGTGGTITTPSSYTSTVTGLSAGSYVFRLTATDNNGATGFDEMTVLVNPAININPVANAGSDQTITWPVNSVTLSGSGSDADGVIVAYNWTKISGGSATITNPNSASTTVTGMGIGVYQYQLQVTDNSGGTATDVMQVTLNQGAATIAYTVLSKVFNNTPQGPTIVTSPPGLATTTTFNGVGGLKTNVGSWNVLTGMADPNWTATTISGIFSITPAPETITVSNTVQQYDSTLKNVSVSTSPVGIATTITGAPQRYKNVYPISVSNADPNYSGSTVNTTLTITAGTTTVTWNPADLVYPNPVGINQTNATSPKTGIYTYTPPTDAIISAGTQPLKLDFVPSDTNIAPINGIIRNITVSKGTDAITVMDTVQFADGNPKFIIVSSSHGGTITVTYTGAHTAVGDYPFSATYSDANWQAVTVTGTLHILSNSALIFITNYSNRVYTGSPIVPTVTSPYSYTLTYNPIGHTNVGSTQVIATINDGIHSGADTQTLTIIKATPATSWPAIASGVYPYVVSGGILNASSPITGTWAYSISVGDTLSVGTLIPIAGFTPTDASNYNSVVITNTIVVTKGTATINASNFNQVYDSTLKRITVSTTPANLDSLIILYSGSLNPPRDAGSYPFTVNLSNALYNASQVSGTLVIAKGSSILSWLQIVPISSGTKLSALQLNPTSNHSGYFTFNYPINTILPVGTTLLVATFHPDNPNYNTQTISQTIGVYGNPFLNYLIGTYFTDLPNQ